MEIALLILSIIMIGLPSHIIARSIVSKVNSDTNYTYPLTILITVLVLAFIYSFV